MIIFGRLVKIAYVDSAYYRGRLQALITVCTGLKHLPVDYVYFFAGVKNVSISILPIKSAIVVLSAIGYVQICANL